MEDIELSEYNVTCETPDCENGGMKIKMLAPSQNPHFICGVCLNEITNYKIVK